MSRLLREISLEGIGDWLSAELVDQFFERLYALARRMRERCAAEPAAHPLLVPLGDALVASMQSKDRYPQHLAQALLDPLRDAAAAQETVAFMTKMVESAEIPSSFELILCLLSYAPPGRAG